MYSAVGLTFPLPTISETQPVLLSLVSDAEFITSEMRKDSVDVCCGNQMSVLQEQARASEILISTGWQEDFEKSLQNPKKIFYNFD